MNYKHKKPRPSASCWMCKPYKFAGNGKERHKAKDRLVMNLSKELERAIDEEIETAPWGALSYEGE